MSGDRQGNPPSPTPEVMTIDDLAAYLQVSKSSLYKLVQDGRVPGQKVGRHWRFLRETINRWLEEGHSVGPEEGGRGTP
jgi:excisionase family DNA binding protein